MLKTMGLLIAMLLATSTMQAETIFTLSGTALNENGVPLRGALITVRNTEMERSTVVRENGTYSIADVAAGEYVVETTGVWKDGTPRTEFALWEECDGRFICTQLRTELYECGSLKRLKPPQVVITMNARIQTEREDELLVELSRRCREDREDGGRWNGRNFQ